MINASRQVKIAKPMKKHDTGRNSTNNSNSRYLAEYPDVLTPTECMNILSVGRNAIYSLLQKNFSFKRECPT